MHIKWEKTLHRICTAVTAILIFAAVAGAIWNLSLFLFNADVLDDLGNQKAASGDSDLTLWLFRDNALTTGFIALCIAVFVLLVATAILMGIKKNPCSQNILPERRGALQIIRIFTGFALLAIPVIYTVFYMHGFDLGKFRGTMNLAAMIFALPASLYFLFPGIADRFSEFLQTVFGLCFIVFSILSLANTHMYMYEGLTSPVRTFNLLSLTAMMLFMLYEIRFFAAKPLPNLYVASAGAAVFFCGINGLPRLILTLLGETSVSIQTMYACLELMIALYAICRLLLFLAEWGYTLKLQAEALDTLPETVTLQDPVTLDDTVEPDYTEDSEIESPILEAEIDLDLFDRAFEGKEDSDKDALDTIMQNTSLEKPTDENDALKQLLNETAVSEESADSDSFDTLTKEVFGTNEEGT